MPEEQQYQGDRWTKMSVKLMESIGWTQVGDSNIDIECVNKLEHKSKSGNPRKSDHGIDSMFKFNDPFLNSNDVGVVVESKHRKWSGINSSSIKEFCDQLLMSIDCVKYSEKIKELGLPHVSDGLILIWCNEPDLFDRELFKDYLSEIELPQKKIPTTIYIASNDEILRWASIINYTNKLIANNKFEFYYPSDYFSKNATTGTTAKRENHLTLTYLYSKYIFGKSIETIDAGRLTYDNNINHIFFFEKPEKKELKIAYQLLKRYQFEDANKIVFHFYGEQTAYRSDIEDFKREINSTHSNKEELEVEFNILDILATVPE